MKMIPLSNLITGKEFDRYQSGLSSRFRMFGYSYEYTQDVDGVPILKLDFDTKPMKGKVVVSENGKLSLIVYESGTNKKLFEEYYTVNSANEFHKLYPKLFVFIREKIFMDLNV